MTQAKLFKEDYNQEANCDELYSNYNHKYDAWFRSEVAKGLKDVENGKVISQEEAERILYQI